MIARGTAYKLSWIKYYRPCARCLTYNTENIVPAKCRGSLVAGGLKRLSFLVCISWHTNLAISTNIFNFYVLRGKNASGRWLSLKSEGCNWEYYNLDEFGEGKAIICHIKLWLLSMSQILIFIRTCHKPLVNNEGLQCTMQAILHGYQGAPYN